MFAGMDTAQFPGLTVMKELKKQFAFTGFYLWKAPSQRVNYGWMTHRKELLDQGWGLVPTFLGRQTAGPGARLPTDLAKARALGAADGTLATSLMVKAGFTKGWFCFIDIENPPPAKYVKALDAYVTVWAHALESGIDTSFRPGIYCSHLISTHMRTLLPQARIWDFRVGSISKKKHNVGYPIPTPAPTLGSHLTQREQNALVPVLGKRLLVDLNTSLTSNPGA